MRTIFIFFFSFIFFIAKADSTAYKIGILESPPFTYLDENNQWKGINVWLLEKIAEEQNFDYEFVPVQKDSFKNQSIDLYIYPIIIDKQNIKQLDFTPTYYTTDSAILIENVTGFQAVWNFIKSILSLNFLKLVIAIFTLLLIVGLIVWIFERKRNSDQFESSWKGIGSGLWWSAVTLSTVGYGDISPKTLGGRIVGTIWMFSGILVVAAFTASMASLLTINQINTNNSSITDYKHKVIGVLDHSPSKAYLERNFFKRIEPFKTFEDGVEALETAKIDAYIGDEAYLNFFIEKDSVDDFTLLEHKFNPQYYSFGVHQNKTDFYLMISRNLIEVINGVEWQLLLEEYNISYH